MSIYLYSGNSLPFVNISFPHGKELASILLVRITKRLDSLLFFPVGSRGRILGIIKTFGFLITTIYLI